MRCNSSGRRGPIAWHTSPINVQRTQQALKILIDDFVVNPTYQDTVTSIEALNEPGGFIGGNILDVTKQYYYDSYGALRWPYGTSKQADTLLRSVKLQFASTARRLTTPIQSARRIPGSCHLLARLYA
jgi:hypothetical protein